MGSGRWSTTDWATYATAHVASKPAAQVFTTRKLLDEFNPAKIAFRESRDSADNPNSLPILLGSDVTGSMGMIADTLIRSGLNDVASALQADRSIGDAHVMVAAIGDANFDEAPLQVTQFEADIRIAQQTKMLWLEAGGGYNFGESYPLLYLFAAEKVRSDAWDKRRKKGLIFTIGDEPPVDVLPAHASGFLGLDFPHGLSARQCADRALQRFEVFHILLTNEGRARTQKTEIAALWEKVLPQRVIMLDDVSRLASTVVATIKGVGRPNSTAVAGVAPASKSISRLA